MKPQQYRDVIDELVRACHEGQGQVSSKRAKIGLWNVNATPDYIPDQYAINQLLKSLDSHQREVLAAMLEHEFENGVFNALRVLEECRIPPFEEGYEGSPYNDFIGRLDDWEWPE